MKLVAASSQRGGDLVPERGGELHAGVEEIDAAGGGDRESGRHGKFEAAHFGEIGALAAQQVFHRSIAVGLAAAEGVDILGSRQFSHTIPLSFCKKSEL